MELRLTAATEPERIDPARRLAGVPDNPDHILGCQVENGQPVADCAWRERSLLVLLLQPEKRSKKSGLPAAGSVEGPAQRSGCQTRVAVAVRDIGQLSSPRSA